MIETLHETLFLVYIIGLEVNTNSVRLLLYSSAEKNITKNNCLGGSVGSNIKLNL